jgi:hypothetical protein
MTYTIATSAGIISAAQQEEKMQYAGLYRKANFALTKGVNFVQLDLESISEFQEPGLVENMKKIQGLKINYGLHSETPAFGSREFPHLDSAIDVDYRRGHERLQIIIENAGKIKCVYMLMHSSESTPFIFLSRELQPTDLVDIWGRPLGEFIEQEGNISGQFVKLLSEKPVPRNWIKEWLEDPKQGYIWVETFTEDLQSIIDRDRRNRKIELKQLYRRQIAQSKLELQRRIDESKNPELAKQQIIARGEELPDFEGGLITPEDEARVKELESKINNLEEDEQIRNIKEIYMSLFLRNLKSRSLHYGPERTAYYITAKWMEINNDPLWNDIINITLKYYAKRDGISEEEWLEKKGIKKVDGKWSIEDDEFRKFYQLWVPAVSAKYLWGHFMPEKCPTKTRYSDPKKLLKNAKIFFVLETPMASPGMEDLLRFAQPAQMYYLAKAINAAAGEEVMNIAIDVEHMLMDGLNVETAFDILPEDGGSLIRVVHTGWPSPLGPAHIPIPIGSDQQRYLYETYYKLRQKGMGKTKECYVVFERAGGQDPIQQSVLALRMIKEELERDTSPDHLPLKFYGISPEGFLSEQRQRAMVFEHRYEPLKGLIVTPEEEHTFLGKSALEKPGMTPEKWKKEELR